MTSHALLQAGNLFQLALMPTTVDRIVVWGALALVIGLIAWREYTLPDVSPPQRATQPAVGWEPRAVASGGLEARSSAPPVREVPLEARDTTPAL